MPDPKAVTDDDEEEEDYMSDSFLAKCGDTKGPGLLPKSIAKRHEVEKKRIETNNQHRLENKSLKVLESETRDKGLNNALTSENKGFRLLQKMGYKPGTAIGKEGTGKLEPVPIELRTGRGGLGQELERKRRLDERASMQAAMAQKRQRCEAQWRSTLRSKFVEKEQEKDLIESQRVCLQLDEELEIAEPARQFFWPATVVEQTLDRKAEDEEEEDYDEEDIDEEHEDINTISTSNDPDISDKLLLITDYLRSTYQYCVWCGTKFNDAEDMLMNCPGNTADDHS